MAKKRTTPKVDNTPHPAAIPGEVESITNTSTVPIRVSDDILLLPGETIIDTKVPETAIGRYEVYTRKLTNGRMVRITRNIDTGEKTVEHM